MCTYVLALTDVLAFIVHVVWETRRLFKCCCWLNLRIGITTINHHLKLTKSFGLQDNNDGDDRVGVGIFVHLLHFSSIL